MRAVSNTTGKRLSLRTINYREFVPKKQKKSKNGDHKIRVAEIHLSKIAKLDRAEKRDSDAPVPELGPETEAPF